MTIAPGTRIGPYEIAGLIGVGGMGEVYRAHDGRLERDVALKLMSADASGDAARLRRMQQEARAVGQLSHPNILAVFDVGVHEDRMYVVAELLSGESLRDVVKRGPVPWRSALGYALQTAEGLAAAHEHGIVHRDIKPDNVFVTKDKRIKILDFGVATRREPENGALPADIAATVSQDGLLIGTVGYMSPEQARGQTVDHRTDIFAFGCLLYELLTGQQAFTASTPLEVLVAIQRDTPPAIQDFVPSVAVDLVRIVDRCLEKDAARRFQSTRDLLFALTLLQTTGPSADSAPVFARVPPEHVAAIKQTPPKRSIRASIVVGLAAALLLGAGATIAFRGAFAAPEESPFYRQITFRRGTVYTARFTLDGTSIVYSAAWDGGSRELFTTVSGTRDSRPMDQSETDAAFMLLTGEIGLIRRSSGGFSSGVLSRMPLSGGPSKEMLNGVRWADGSPDGADLLVVKTAGGKRALEMPPGHVLAESLAITYPRISPDRQHVAFLEHTQLFGDSGRLVIVDRNGQRTLETPVWKSIEGVAWRDNHEVWFGASKEGRSLWLHAIDMKGKTRVLCRAPGRLVLHDLFSDGRVLAERNSFRSTLMVGTNPEGKERDMSWQDYSQLGQLSRDGKQMLFSEEGDGAGTGSTVYLRSLEGGVPLRLADGLALALSPDAKKALIRVGDEPMHLEVVPVGAGSSERLPMGPLTSISWASFVPGAERLLILGKEANKGNRLYLQDLPSADPRVLTAEEVDVGNDALSPDGSVVAAMQNGKTVLIPLDGGAVRELTGLDGRVPVGFTSDGRMLFVRSKDALPIIIDRYDLGTGKIEPWRTLMPTDSAGLLVLGRVSLARDGEVYAYESYRLLSDLYVIENLK